ncbi:MAG: DsbE family thiol:disulfide interchange protein [Alphaproteobacteria bacterium]|nr:DsbE family thiol:disulfide interchange protein [Alphaproteobacteria bacterium]
MNKAQLLRLLPLLLMLVISILLVSGLLTPERTRGRMEGKKLASFSIDRVDDPLKRMTIDTFRGKVSVVNVFASWCKPCRAEHPVVMALAESGRVAVYGIAWHDKRDKTVEYLQQAGNPYQLIGDDKFGRATVPFGLSGVPETFVIGKDGTIRYHHVSGLSKDDVVNGILPLVDKLNAEAYVPPRDAE